jgi:hypothetical protein
MNRRFLKNFLMRSWLQSKKDHGLPIWQITKQPSSFRKITFGNNAKSSSMNPTTMYDMSRTCLKLERTIFCVDVLIKKKQRRYCGNVTIHHMEVTSMEKERLLRCSNPGFFWPTLFKDAYTHCKFCEECQ